MGDTFISTMSWSWFMAQRRSHVLELLFVTKPKCISIGLSVSPSAPPNCMEYVVIWSSHIRILLPHWDHFVCNISPTTDRKKRWQNDHDDVGALMFWHKFDSNDGMPAQNRTQTHTIVPLQHTLKRPHLLFLSPTFSLSLSLSRWLYDVCLSHV